MKTKFIFAMFSLALMCVFTTHAQSPSPSSGKKPSILVLWGDDIGYWNVSAYNLGMMGLQDAEHPHQQSHQPQKDNLWISRA